MKNSILIFNVFLLCILASSSCTQNNQEKEVILSTSMIDTLRVYLLNDTTKYYNYKTWKVVRRPNTGEYYITKRHESEKYEDLKGRVIGCKVLHNTLYNKLFTRDSFKIMPNPDNKKLSDNENLLVIDTCETLIKKLSNIIDPINADIEVARGIPEYDNETGRYVYKDIYMITFSYYSDYRHGKYHYGLVQTKQFPEDAEVEYIYLGNDWYLLFFE